jgi:basic membrane protein A
MMRKIGFVALVLVMVDLISLGAPFRVAVILPSTINDFAWSQSMYEALMAIQEEMGEENFQFVYSENMYVIADAAAAIRDYAAQGYDLIIAHGSQYGSSLVDIAPDFPKTSFVWGSTAQTFTELGIHNIFAYAPHAEEGGYVNGVIAALLTKTGIIGGIGPIKTGDAKRYAAGFEKGIKDTNPDVQVNYTFIGSYSDVALASEAARTFVNAGADVLTGTAQMTVGAISVAKEKGITWLGYDVDQSPLAPKTVAASIVVDWTVALKPIIAMIREGKYGGEILPLTFANGGLKLVLNDAALEGKLSPAEIIELKALVWETLRKIVSGEIIIEVE